jgi:hypothetical protein
MTMRRVRDVAHSVRDRLANRARETGRPFQEDLTYYAIERFLYRLSTSRHAERFVLKGALMIQVWDAPRARPTRDADFLGYGDSSVEGIERVIREVIESAGRVQVVARSNRAGPTSNCHSCSCWACSRYHRMDRAQRELMAPGTPNWRLPSGSMCKVIVFPRTWEDEAVPVSEVRPPTA